MGVMICAVLLLTTWVAFVFSKYNPDRRITSGSVRRPPKASVASPVPITIVLSFATRSYARRVR